MSHAQHHQPLEVTTEQPAALGRIAATTHDALDSPGSSISSSLQREYDSLLSYAVPHFGIDLGLDVGLVNSADQRHPEIATPPPLPPLPQSALTLNGHRGLTQTGQTELADDDAGQESEATVQEDNEAEEAEVKTDRAKAGSLDAEASGFDPSKTQLIEGLGNTGTSLMESLKGTGEIGAAGSAATCGSSAAVSLLPSLAGVDVPMSQQADLAFNRHVDFEGDLSGLLHASNADFQLSQTLGRWCEDLSRRMMEANHRVKLDLRDRAERLVREEKARLLVDMRNLRDENARLRESLKTHRAALAAKDAELRASQEKLLGAHERIRAARSFAEWRARLEAARREAAHERVADQHYRRALARRALAVWKGRLEVTWRQLVERGCQEKAMRVCEELGAECEDKVHQLQIQLDAARLELRQERAERERAEASMREALMRGVSALNMEAMRAFGGGYSDAATAGSVGKAEAAHDEDDDDSKPMARSPRPTLRGHLPVEPPTTSLRRQQPAPAVAHPPRRRSPAPPPSAAPTLVQAGLPGGGVTTIGGRANGHQQQQRQASSVLVEKHGRPAPPAGMSATLPNFCSPTAASFKAVTSQAVPGRQQRPATTGGGELGRTVPHRYQQTPLAAATIGGFAGADQHIRFVD